MEPLLDPSGLQRVDLTAIFLTANNLNSYNLHIKMWINMEPPPPNFLGACKEKLVIG